MIENIVSTDDGSEEEEEVVEQDENEQELKISCVIKLQACMRRFLQRSAVLKSMRKRFEKILDPKTGKYYYYDTIKDRSTWIKPSIFLADDVLAVAPTYLNDQAATFIQNAIRRYFCKKKARGVFKSKVVQFTDDGSKLTYFFNPNSMRTYYDLPRFMNDIYDYTPIWEAKKVEKEKKRLAIEAAKKKKDALIAKRLAKGLEPDDSEEDEISEEESEEDSVDSDNSEIIRQKRIASRKFPRYCLSASIGFIFLIKLL